jgi:hypothetical protein
MESPQSRHKWHHKKRESHTDLLHQHIAFNLPGYYYYPTSAKDLKRISSKFRPGQDSNQERARRLTTTRAMPPLKFDV